METHVHTNVHHATVNVYSVERRTFWLDIPLDNEGRDKLAVFLDDAATVRRLIADLQRELARFEGTDVERLGHVAPPLDGRGAATLVVKV